MPSGIGHPSGFGVIGVFLFNSFFFSFLFFSSPFYIFLLPILHLHLSSSLSIYLCSHVLFCHFWHLIPILHLFRFYLAISISALGGMLALCFCDYNLQPFCKQHVQRCGDRTAEKRCCGVLSCTVLCSVQLCIFNSSHINHHYCVSFLRLFVFPSYSGLY